MFPHTFENGTTVYDRSLSTFADATASPGNFTASDTNPLIAYTNGELRNQEIPSII
jgi:hypothetical protein